MVLGPQGGFVLLDLLLFILTIIMASKNFKRGYSRARWHPTMSKTLGEPLPVAGKGRKEVRTSPTPCAWFALSPRFCPENPAQAVDSYATSASSSNGEKSTVLS